MFDAWTVGREGGGGKRLIRHEIGKRGWRGRVEGREGEMRK